MIKKICLPLIAMLLTSLVSCNIEKKIGPDPEGEGESTIIVKAGTDPGVDMKETRANTDLEQYLLEAYNGSKTISRPFGNGIISLNVGTYTITVTSEQSYTMPAWNLPVYQGKAEGVTVEAGQTTQQVPITCTQINSGIRFVFDGSVKDYYNSLTVKIEEQEGNQFLEYGYDNETAGDIAYFEPGALELTLSDGDDPVKIGGAGSKILEVEKRQLWTITLKTSSTLPGEIEVVLDVDEGTDDQTPEFGIGDVEGEGTFASPYSVAGAVNAMPAQCVWIEGFIVAATTVTRANPNAVLIGATADAIPAKCLIMEIPAGATLLSGLLEESAVGQKVKIQGDVDGKSGFITEAIAVISNIVNYDDDSRDIGADTASPITIDGKTFKNISAGSNFRMGATVKTDNMTALSGKDIPAGYANLLRRDYNSITLEYEMKMSLQVDLNNGDQDYRAAWLEKLPDYCYNNDMAVHGHTLVWYQDVPGPSNTEDWTKLTPDEVKTKLENYIETTMIKYNFVRSWDVVNEAINNSNGGYWDCLWKDVYEGGENYVREVFKIARRVAKENNLTCKLFYNDYATERFPTKRNAVIAMVEKLNGEHAAENAGEVLIDGIGLQMHLVAGISKSDLAAAIEAAVGTGCLIHLSEVSVSLAESEAGVPSEITQEMLDKQTRTFSDLFSAAFENIPKDKFWGITFWGVNDSYSVYPKRQAMPFDAGFIAKPAYFELINRWGE